MVIVVRCLILRVSVVQTLTECHCVPGRVPRAKDTNIIKKRSLPSRIFQSNAKTHIKEAMINIIMRFSTGSTGTLGRSLPVLLGSRQVGEACTEEITLELSP